MANTEIKQIDYRQRALDAHRAMVRDGRLGSANILLRALVAHAAHIRVSDKAHHALWMVGAYLNDNTTIYIRIH